MRSRDIGDEWETELARRISGKKVPGSGAKWHSKLDVRGRGTIWSAKATEAASFRVDADMLREMRSSIGTPGALGIDVTPILGVRLGGGEEVVVIQLDDFLSLIDSGDAEGSKSDKSAVKPTQRNRSAQLFREVSE